MNVCESLTRTARWFPDQDALVFGDSTYDYRTLNSLSASAADWLLQQGVASGDRVALMLPNAPSFVVWYYAALRIGAIAVSISTRLSNPEVEYTLDDCQACALIAEADFFSKANRVLPDSVRLRGAATSDGDRVNDEQLGNDVDRVHGWKDMNPEDAALILYTSGTTGFPKGATLSHGNVRSNVHAFNHLCRTRPEDRVLLAVPLFHCFGQNALLNSVFNVGGNACFAGKV